MAKKYTAQCACGAVKTRTSSPTAIAWTARGPLAARWPRSSPPQGDFTLVSGSPKARRYVAASGKALDRNFCPDCGSRLFTSNLESFPGLVFVMPGSLDKPELVAPKLENVHQAPPEVGEAARPAAVRQHAELNREAFTPLDRSTLRTARPMSMAVRQPNPEGIAHVRCIRGVARRSRQPCPAADGGHPPGPALVRFPLSVLLCRPAAQHDLRRPRFAT